MRFSYFSSFVFIGNHVFNEEGKPWYKINLVEEEPDDIDIDDIGHIGDLPKLVFIDEEC